MNVRRLLARTPPTITPAELLVRFRRALAPLLGDVPDVRVWPRRFADGARLVEIGEHTLLDEILPALVAALAVVRVRVALDRRLAVLQSTLGEALPAAPRPPPRTKRERSIELVVLGPDGVKPHDDFGDRLRRFDARDPRTDPHELPPDDPTWGVESTALASVAMKQLRRAADVGIWSMLVGHVSDALRALDFLASSHAATARVVATNWTIAEENGVSATVRRERLEPAIRRARRAGIVFVAAAGNLAGTRGTQIVEPAIHRDVIAVGGWADRRGSEPGFDPKDHVHPYSSRGSPGSGKPDLLGFFGAHDVADAEGDASSRRQCSGTSMAVGEPAAMLALLCREHPGRTADELSRLLADACRSVGTSEQDASPAPPHFQGAGALAIATTIAGLATPKGRWRSRRS